MEIQFQGENRPSRYREKQIKLNFVAQWIIRIGLTKNPKLAQGLSLIIAAILIVWSLISIMETFSEEPIDPKYYYDPATDTSNN